METADLHFHSTYSDGKHSIDWLSDQLKKAKESGLRLATLTDHDGIQGFEEFSESVSSFWKPICASELSCTFLDPSCDKERELHLLVYGIEPKDKFMKAQFEKFRSARENRFFKICEKLAEAGYPLDGKAFAKKHPGVLGRPHVADALVESGVVQSRAEAFERFLKDRSPFFVKKWKFPLEEAVGYMRKKGWRTSIAHPGQYRFREETLKYFRDIGVDAIEVVHPRHTDQERDYYIEEAKVLGFLMSGGSDFHTYETDVFGKNPSLGRCTFDYETAKKLLGAFL